jgi:hypothetical protein
VQLAIGEFALEAGLVALPDDCGLIAPIGEMAIEAIVGDVELGALEPLDGDVAIVGPVPDLVPLLEPVHVLLGHLAPESLGVVDGPPVHGLVLVLADQRAFGGARKHVVGFVGHGSLLVLTPGSRRSVVASSRYA